MSAPLDASIGAAIARNAAERPQAAFLLAPEPGLTLTYGALAQRLDELAQRLYGLGLAPGDKVAFLLDIGCWTTLLFLATVRAGLVTVPLNAVAGTEQLAYVLELSEQFRLMMHGEDPSRMDDLEDAIAFQGVAKFPVRVKCALLGWMAVKDAIETYRNGDAAHAVTHD